MAPRLTTDEYRINTNVSSPVPLRARSLFAWLPERDCTACYGFIPRQFAQTLLSLAEEA